jgi:hypothetical protein
LSGGETVGLECAELNRREASKSPPVERQRAVRLEPVELNRREASGFNDW